MRGKLIVIEGLDGSGKTTQLEMLKKGFPRALFITFPDYESYSGKIIKQYLDGGFGKSDGVRGAYSASSFYAVDRYISYQTSWSVDYLGGTDIISARYTSSNAIYQMSKLPEKDWGEYLNWLDDYEHEKLGIPRPDMTVFLDVPLETSQRLLSERYNGVEGKKDIHEGNLYYLKKCGEAALFVAERENWKRLNCMDCGVLKSPADINAELKTLIGVTLNAGI